MTAQATRSVHASGRGRRPVDAVAAARHAHGRPAVWDALRRLKGGTVAELSKASGAPQRTVRGFLQTLEFAGFVMRSGAAGPLDGMRYQVARELPALMPDLRPDGTLAPETGRARMWRTMKMLSTFTAKDVAIAASLPGATVALAEARKYAVTLSRAGYLATIKPGTPHGGLATYRLVKNTGPQAPQIQRRATLFDPNQGQVVWAEWERA